MPRATFNYPFEARVHGAVLAVSGDPADKMLLRFDRGPTCAQVFRGEAAVNERRDGADRRPFIYYDGFDVPDYAFLEWQAMSREMMEAWLGRSFEATDFTPYHNKATSTVLPPGQFPADWSVIL